MYKDFEDVYNSHYQLVHRYVRHMIRNNDAAVDDVVQDVFYITYAKWEAVKHHPNVPGFLVVVARYRVKKWYEQQSKLCVNEESVLEFLESEYGGISDGYIAGNTAGTLNLAEETNPYSMVDLYATMEKVLTHKEIQILRQFYEYGYTGAEMAEQLGITESCFKVRLLRMKEKLKQSLKGFNPLLGLLPVLLSWKWL